MIGKILTDEDGKKWEVRTGPREYWTVVNSRGVVETDLHPNKNVMIDKADRWNAENTFPNGPFSVRGFRTYAPEFVISEKKPTPMPELKAGDFVTSRKDGCLFLRTILGESGAGSFAYRGYAEKVYTECRSYIIEVRRVKSLETLEDEVIWRKEP